MPEIDPAMQPLFARLAPDTARSYGLVLMAEDIPHLMSRRAGFWSIAVAPSDRGRAVEAIGLFLSENRAPDPGPPPRPATSRTYSALYIAVILGLIHFSVIPGHERQVFVDTFGADAARILAGEIYRCVTALLYHADGAHLAGNLAALAVFGTAVASLCGWGSGWLMILAGGVAGNWVNAFWYRQGHVSIGASTAIFAAVGICAALSFWIHWRSRPRSPRMWLPLAGGMALLAFMGTSAQSDLMAHLWGFLWGVLLGIGYGKWCARTPSRPIQLVAAGGAAAVVAACWMWGLYHSG